MTNSEIINLLEMDDDDDELPWLAIQIATLMMAKTAKSITRRYTNTSNAQTGGLQLFLC